MKTRSQIPIIVVLLTLMVSPVCIGQAGSASPGQPKPDSTPSRGTAVLPSQNADGEDSVMHFGGATNSGEDKQCKPPRHLDHYIPLSSMPSREREELFLMWVGRVYASRATPRNVAGVNDPVLLREFAEEYESGAWRKLGVGLTLEEVFFMLELGFGAPSMTLINETVPQEFTSQIARERKLFLSANVILEFLNVHFERMRYGHLKYHKSVQTLYYDKLGHTGHSILLLDSDSSTHLFAYFDPWPCRSLLAEENNNAGIKAHPLPPDKLFEVGRYTVRAWSVTDKELAGVLVAAFVDPEEFRDFVALCRIDDRCPRDLRDQIDEAILMQWAFD
ncbi:MAG TPA: hypothetical protein VGJ30_05115 [Candidatus Angelobacter sp.]|jgi:hypothetical protein